ncbi:MAG: (2Fe-2S) ferredoxin domain-containing protein [Bacteroidetes bacterium]|nr:(2Fe-2S) ferredoxin domain-containing protein [Bacteroidota bacterium]
MKKPDFHILVCNSYRIAGNAQGACNRKNAPQMIQYLTEGAVDRGLDVTVSSTGCLNICAQGPIVVVQPQNVWYGGIESEDQMDELLDALENGEEVEKYKISD